MENLPQYDWQSWKFHRVSTGHWTNIENQKGFLEKIGKDLGIIHLDDWYQFGSKVSI